VDTAAFQSLASGHELSLARGAANRNGEPPRTSEPSDVWFSRHVPPDLDPLTLAEAVALYRGEFMAGVYLDGCPEFETWLIREREFWRRQATEALELLIAHHALHRQDDQAQACARRWIELEPWQEDAHRYLMLLLARNGKRSAALVQYEACGQALATELEVEPSDETIALYKQIRSDELDQIRGLSAREVGTDGFGQALPMSSPLSIVSSPMHDSGEAPEVDSFYGRTAELATLERWLTDERCRVVVLLGMGGMGKTVVAAQLARRLADQFDCVIWRSLLNAPPLVETLRACILSLSAQELTDPPKHLDDQLALLLDLFRRRRCLLVLDNYESILQAGARAGVYRPGYEEYGQL